MIRRRVAALIAVPLLLAACGGASADSGSSSGSGAGASASAAAAAPATDAAATDAAAVGGGPSAKELCAYLSDELPKLKGMSEVGAMAQVTMGIAGVWGDEHIQELGSADLDGMTTAECPGVRADVLKAMGVDSFSAL